MSKVKLWVDPPSLQIKKTILLTRLVGKVLIFSNYGLSQNLKILCYSTEYTLTFCFVFKNKIMLSIDDIPKRTQNRVPFRPCKRPITEDHETMKLLAWLYISNINTYSILCIWFWCTLCVYYILLYLPHHASFDNCIHPTWFISRCYCFIHSLMTSIMGL